MQLSWSHKLFFLANRYSGRWKFFDRAVIFFAKNAIFAIGLAAVWQIGDHVSWEWINFSFLIGKFLLGSGLALGLSWLFGWLYPHRRPVIEFPEVKEIIKPLSHWKSLPSDHAIMSALLAYFIFFLPSAPSIALSYFFWAIIISVARVFAGVHYPRDIVAGWILATTVAFIFWR
ncbi:MAG: hypothetical protein A2821_04420 [Candidatus Magasanikbacteria bacterium RIFCSPHIGHO2_01_FULL_41_23]|uniref:Phosphatidic acid phosphatase type 2/haloperoxidase domain-containing protein n=1 Tax=Candidatus Magasanikbacteria bacterium RIFCSPLOWO2_01_FULL_40_15 TaxID=1798686 RepID=A0A1F6N466_9BACT|nr:MAG: hypothetical protein A2821_04420 [Candidatus Magasanikbacteria bacterium RIFCSPHIGHO2_01_FULL_41_23]OGH67170.1 MAG: hypothetical protein A3C66_02735 [Candidatus Magasanikbacteria bacterium RIFCSPHIGHO2_02_FULL_41_35]OGH75465.1 MAG: hypothetical protein A3F22_01410 [Candidatus Magasanikbacteria bacterium RIFCSPHIGHO2_12_FULL_41_16]OGH78707.1 MAG: hypothetical protein A2983_04375 [Candidatus Magasanikbacteria bacterium RIFCSPLOWO2_01_FULL_40_15]